MNIEYLIQLLTNRLNGLNLAKDQAFQAGDLERIIAVDAEILDVQNTIGKLKLVSTIEQTAAATPFTEAEVVKNGIEASFNPTIVNDSTQPLIDYDITSYATDPYHEMKIQNILEKMGPMDSPEKIEAYIKKSAPDSPLNGVMVWDAATQHAVDSRLMMALMELDSRFGTVGIAVDTLNPGNIGNNGTDTKTFSSWQEGVLAVALWLRRHRSKNNDTENLPEVVNPVDDTPLENIETDETKNEEEALPEPIIGPIEEENVPKEEFTPEIIPSAEPSQDVAPVVDPANPVSQIKKKQGRKFV